MTDRFAKNAVPAARAVEASTDAHKELSAKPGQFTPDSIDDALKLARVFYDSGLMPKHFYEDKRVHPDNRRTLGIAGIATMIMYGVELGLSPMQSFRMMHVIEGRPVLSAEGCVGLVKRSPRCVYFRVVEASNNYCICETVRRGDDGKPLPARRLRVNVHWGDAKSKPQDEKDVLWVLPTRNRDGALTPAWERNPGRMVKARCSMWLSHDEYEDVIAGLYSAEEMIDIRDTRGTDAILSNVLDMVDMSPTVVRGAGTDPTFEADAPLPAPEAQSVTSSLEAAPAKPAPTRAEWKALHDQIVNASDTILPEQIDTMRRELARFDDAHGRAELLKAWAANGTLGAPEVAS